VHNRTQHQPEAVSANCPYCLHEGIFPVGQHNLDFVERNTKPGLHFSSLVERIVPYTHNLRPDAETAVSNAYTQRAILGIALVLNRFEQFPKKHKLAAKALLLSALDLSNKLWPFPDAEYRPKRLRTLSNFKENNLWNCLEASVKEWTDNSIVEILARTPIEICEWPDQPGGPGICLFPGKVSQLAASAQNINIDGVLSVIPRANQAFWSLSAIWAGWLMGRRTANQISSVLKRKRYEWGWHSDAISGVFKVLERFELSKKPSLLIVAEPETGFNGAVFSACIKNGIDLASIAMRKYSTQIQISGKFSEQLSAVSDSDPLDLKEKLRAEIPARITEYLEYFDEPRLYSDIQIGTVKSLSNEIPVPYSIQSSELTQIISEEIEHSLGSSKKYQKYSGTMEYIENSKWQLNVIERVHKIATLSWTDKIEIHLFNILSKGIEYRFDQIDKQICAAFPGLATPPIPFLQTCLNSYSNPVDATSHLYQIRKEDEPESRNKDLNTISDVLDRFGQKFGLISQVVTLPEDMNTYSEHPLTNMRVIVWSRSNDELQTFFIVSTSGILCPLNKIYQLINQKYKSRKSQINLQNVLVVPGGRSGLINFKIKNGMSPIGFEDLSWRFMKFRHIRRMAEKEPESCEQFQINSSQDPLENEDPQILLI
jgi:hypothetical protein